MNILNPHIVNAVIFFIGLAITFDIFILGIVYLVKNMSKGDEK